MHAVYVLPSDAADRALDTSGVLEASFGSFQRWLSGQTGGRALRPDTFAGSLDVTFHRSRRTDASIAASGVFVRDELERELRGAGLIAPGKLYAVYYDGTSTFSCGGGAWPPVLPGQVGALYLRGAPPGAPACATNAFAPAGAPPGYFEFAMLHELLHTLGFVATCAPHHTLAGHVSDSPADLMYAGPLDWRPFSLDVGRDDYFGHARGGCLDFATSPFLELQSAVPRTPLTVGRVAAAGRPRAGRTFSISAAADGTPGSVACSARLAGRRLAARASLRAGRIACSLRIPRGARGKRLVVTLTATRGDERVSRTATFRVR